MSAGPKRWYMYFDGRHFGSTEALKKSVALKTAIREAGAYGALKRRVTVKLANPSSARRNPTKAQKREKAKKAAGKRRIAEALKKFVQKANPAAKGVVKATKVKGGWNVRVIKLNPKSLTELEADGRRILGFAPKKKSTGGRYSAYTSEAALQKALAKSKRGRK